MRRIALGLLAVAGLAVVAAACGGDDDSGDSPTPTPTEDGASPETTTTATLTGNLQDLRDLLTKSDTATFAVTYDFTSSNFGGLDGVLLLSSDPPARAFDFDGTTPIGDGRFLLIDDGAASFLCIAQDGEESCAEGAAAGDIAVLAGLSVTEIIEDVLADEETVARELEGRTIAGTEARCFELTGSVTDGTICAGEDGVPLHLSGTFDGVSVTLDATSRAAPASGAFEPPFPVE